MQWTKLTIAGLALALLTTACSSPAECELDTDCGTGVCARDGACTTASEVRNVKTTWTINGAAPTQTSCSAQPLYIEFVDDDTDETLEYDPVPCLAGQYVIDKLPRRFDSVEVGVDIDGGAWDATIIDANDSARLDLPLGPSAMAAPATNTTHAHRQRRAAKLPK